MSLSSPDDSTAVQDQLHDVQQTFPANREKQLAIPGFAVSCRFPRSPSSNCPFAQGAPIKN